jgi:hypothetical protein
MDALEGRSDIVLTTTVALVNPGLQSAGQERQLGKAGSGQAISVRCIVVVSQ